MNLLRQDYLSNRELWIDFTPENAAKNRLVIVNASHYQEDFYTQKGWQVLNFILAPGLPDTPNSIRLPLVYKQWPILPNGNSVVILNQVLDHLGEPGEFLLKLSTCLEIGGKFWIRLSNPFYFSNALIRMDYTAKPWPQQAPQGKLFSPEELKETLPTILQMQEVREIMDGLYHDPRHMQWKYISGFMQRLLLPSGANERKRCFVRYFDVELALESRMPSLPVEELPNLHKQIESLLNTGELEPAALLIDKIFQNGLTDAATYNLQGVLYYYRKQYHQAWDSFRLSLEMLPGIEDVYRNILDVAVWLGREEDAKIFVERDAQSYPHLRELL